MSTRKQVKKANKNLYKQIWQLSGAVFKGLMKWLLRSLLVISRRARRRARLSGAGFVLPTVVMVMLVVMLLTTAVLFRSFDRSKNASTVRVNQAVLNAATPALDRTKAKINALFSDTTLPRSTPSDSALYEALSSDRYKFGDETRLKLVYDIDGGGITPDSLSIPLEKKETLTTAWKFAVDTDNNGQFDSFTLYGIYFRSPTRGADGKFNRVRNPLEARTSPMAQGKSTGRCATAIGTSASLVGQSDWYKSGNKLTKSFFAYIATIPITNSDITTLNLNPVDQPKRYEAYKGNKGFSALEFQQDWVQIPLNHNAVWYEDDIEVTNATTVRLNGRIFTNSNLMIAGNASSKLKTTFYQVSDPDSCYYEQENSKIVVSGNVANGDVGTTTDPGLVEVHRFQGQGIAPAGQNSTDDGISSTNKTTTQTGGKSVGYNNKAYSERIGLMVQAALALHTGDPTNTSVSAVTRYPQEVIKRFKQRFNDSNETKEPKQILTEELETYFKEHTRRVPYREVSGSTSSVGSYTATTVLGSTSPIRPPDIWMAIEAPTSGSTTDYTNLPLNFSSNTMNLKATEPTKQQKDGKEYYIGDRILVGNNLPYSPPKYTTTGTFDKFAEQAEQQPVKNGSNAVYWNDPDNSGNATNIQRTRRSQLQILPNLGSVGRDGFWETEAAKQPAANENTGGLRVITGAGVYIDKVAPGVGALGGTGVRTALLLTPNSYFPDDPSLNTGVTEPPNFQTTTIITDNNNIIVWPDLMPMWYDNKKGDLQMRATAVYHYKQGSASTTGLGKVDANQVPIACVSSYYDPTDKTTARNLSGLPDVSGIYDTNLADGSPAVGANNGRSNNGVTYNAPYTDNAGRTLAVTTYRAKLNRQARAIFPTGRIVNEPLRKALINIDAGKDRSLADNAAIDTTICALKILDGTLSVQSSPNVPHGAIKEAVFLDGRQVKSLNNDVKPDNSLDNTKIAETPAKLTDRYNLPLEQRQPLEIRVTELDLKLLKDKEIGTPTNSSNGSANDQEYLLPNSGIIYATRDDALLDVSDNRIEPAVVSPTELLVSPTDFKLDSTRRPNGIRLINGSNLARKNFNRVAEKGLILATNLPAYIKGDFNLHKDPNSSTVREEFKDILNEDTWGNFYTRNNETDPNFACRQNQLGCADTGDQWRPATIISDAQTLLSKNFWDGFRSQGDYDLNHHQGNSTVADRLNKGGFWNNNFVTSADWVNTSSGYPKYRNSYLTNGVTPIQRRGSFPEYLMEVCIKLPVTACKPEDWYVNPATTIRASAVVGQSFNISNHKAGTTALPAAEEYQRYPRRLAVLRDGSNNLVTQPATGGAPSPTPIPIGINSSGNIALYPYTGTRSGYSAYSSSNKPRNGTRALWYRTSSSANNPTQRSDNSTDRYNGDFPLQYILDNTDSKNQPGFVPLLQIHFPNGTLQENWLQTANTTTANAAFITGDSPSRWDLSERGGGLHNFVRFLENWTDKTAKIKGSFIQFKRSEYATGPFNLVNLVDTTVTDPSASIFYSLDSSKKPFYSSEIGFRYAGGADSAKSPHYWPPNRAYGFDVALLSQSPDLFAQRFTVSATSRPSEYFREVSRDDPWLQNLLCAAQKSGTSYNYAINSSEHPTTGCPSLTSYND